MTTVAKVTIAPESIANALIANLGASSQGVALMAEAYLEAVAKSIFSEDVTKQFVKLEDLTPIFEQNKILEI